MTMSIADEDNIFIFPEDIPVNIANPADIKRLKETFAGKELYIAVGTDVIKNASCYKAAPVKGLHSFFEPYRLCPRVQRAGEKPGRGKTISHYG